MWYEPQIRAGGPLEGSSEVYSLEQRSSAKYADAAS